MLVIKNIKLKIQVKWVEICAFSFQPRKVTRQNDYSFLRFYSFAHYSLSSNIKKLFLQSKSSTKQRIKHKKQV